MNPSFRPIVIMVWMAVTAAACAAPQADGDLLRTLPLADWQSQLLEQVDVDELSEAAYADLMETLTELELAPRADTAQHPVQHVVLRADRCLTAREGYRHATAERRDAGKAYQGAPWHATLRYRLQNGRHWRAAVTLDKDAGERYGDGALSAYVQYTPDRPSTAAMPVVAPLNVIVGDYRLTLGSGLLINQRFTMGKQLMGGQFFTMQPRLSGHSSTEEYSHMRGVAAEVSLGRNWHLLPFVSCKWEGGAIVRDTLTSLRTDGMYRTRTEARQRHLSWLTQAGLRLGRRGLWYDVGLNVRYLHSELPYVRPIRQYNRHAFRGSDLGGASVDYYARRYGLALRGETAVDDAGGWATIAALGGHLGDYWRWTALGRIYSDRYRTMQAAAVSESSAMQGERGAMFSIEGEPWKHWTVRLVADGFHLTVPQYGIYAPSRGWEAAIRAAYQRRRWDVAFHYKFKVKQKNDSPRVERLAARGNPPADGAWPLTHWLRHTLDAVLTLTPVDALRLRTQVRTRTYSQQNTGGYTLGYAVSQSLDGSLPLRLPDHQPSRSSRLTASAQATFFNTDDYDTRIYLTEHQLLYGYGLPMLYGRGMRLSATLRCDVTSRWTVEAKWALTNYDGVDHIGSGLQRIEGNNRQDLWLQVRAKIFR